MAPRFAKRSATRMKSYGSLSPLSKSLSNSASAASICPFATSCCARLLMATFRSTPLLSRSRRPSCGRHRRVEPAAGLVHTSRVKLFCPGGRAPRALFELRALGLGQLGQIDPHVPHSPLRAGATEPGRHARVANRVLVAVSRDREELLQHPDTRLRRAERRARRVPRRVPQRRFAR